MPKQCERPGCSGAAEVLYGFDPGQLLVWLEKGPIVAGSGANALCRRHADALAVPKGWSIDDRREAAPRLFSAPAKEKIVNTSSSRVKAQKNIVAQRPESFDDVELPETKAIPWTPQFDKQDDLGGVLRPKGRLMSRAFGLDDTKTNLRLVRSEDFIDDDISETSDDAEELEREPFNENDIP